ncbi:hypothetical protein SISNIDRAFT_256933 [Sistotremastrum niveocremeum HHB9708]|uniref:Uncharacterized protein n=1 Tax=Sistotremastrum niveocremeum HHB9708 TaxID=1314777 RepID=A0A164PBA9_9AGAM|nr:hypothetical protein SISNIDRAFT_256933 [Sistotremastrum niveocremeum HHB9708]
MWPPVIRLRSLRFSKQNFLSSSSSRRPLCLSRQQCHLPPACWWWCRRRPRIDARASSRWSEPTASPSAPLRRITFDRTTYHRRQKGLPPPVCFLSIFRPVCQSLTTDKFIKVGFRYVVASDSARYPLLAHVIHVFCCNYMKFSNEMTPRSPIEAIPCTNIDVSGRSSDMTANLSSRGYLGSDHTTALSDSTIKNSVAGSQGRATSLGRARRFASAFQRLSRK